MGGTVMGQVWRLPVREWVREYRVTHFVETGTDLGNGVITALQVDPALVVHSIELLPHMLLDAGGRITDTCPGQEHRWCLWIGDSAEVLPELIELIPAEAVVMWWLDAHFPENYNGAGQGTRLPLRREIEALVSGPRDIRRDVILVDDWRVYDDNPKRQYDAGLLPTELRHRDGRLPCGSTDRQDILAALGRTHTIHINPLDEGYLQALPR